MSAKPIPDGYHTITPQLSIDGAMEAIAFYKKAFAAEQVGLAMDPSGKKVWHSVLRIGTSLLFVNDVFPEMGPDAQASRSNLWLYVDDCDAWFQRAVDAGARGLMPPSDMFWGDRMGHVIDPFGQHWTVATHIKDMTPEEMKAAEAAFVAQAKG